MSFVQDEKFAPFLSKMKAEGLSDAAIAAFAHSYQELLKGSSGSIPETTIAGVAHLPDLEGDIRPSTQIDESLLHQVVVLKLNGGLGTSMGLDKAKSLLEVKNGDTFLDLTAKQVISMRKKFNAPIKFMLMNSFNTSKDTLTFLAKYPTIVNGNIELMQNKVPKIDKKTLLPAEWSINKHLEWCPPGHGDLYTALYGSGKLKELLDQGVKYMFVSNSDNLGATLDLDLLTYFAKTGAPFLMECCRRTEADKKGGHLALRTTDNQLILRESAQCSKEDEPSFQDISKHKYFNTNNLWVRLDMLYSLMETSGGYVPLPTIFNGKTVDPQIDSSTAVWQLETAMGAAIECFSGAAAVCVSRERFAPVKKCSDLLLLRSDAYVVNPDTHVLELNNACKGIAPIVNLDDKKYKLVQHLDAATKSGYPSLVGCKKLTVGGEVWLSARHIFVGEVTVKNGASEPKILPNGQYENTSVDLTEIAGLGALRPYTVATTPFTDQKPGTSGLRKKTKVFATGHYLHNFVQATFNALKELNIDVTTAGSLLLGGDGRYYNDEAIQVIVKIAIANGVRHIIIGQDGLLSTPAVSSIIREYSPQWKKPFGSFILTASHNPGGPDEDFGIKYNCENGGPAPEKLTDLIYAHTRILSNFKIANDFPAIDLTTVKSHVVSSPCPCVSGTTCCRGSAAYQSIRNVVVEIIDSTAHHVNLLKTIFDFDAIRALIARPDFKFAYDCMSGVQGKYARHVFLNELGAKPDSLLNDVSLPDFNGQHADPNLVYARNICDRCYIDAAGLPIPFTGDDEAKCLDFGAAADGDADRNMILGRQFFVTPSDSLAIITAHADRVIPFFKLQGGIKSVARSMPTSGAVDLVAKKLNLHLFETPTGWKYFGNVMDSFTLFQGKDYNPMICGEESFGTGSNHIREKDGMWAVLAWLAILAHYNTDVSKPLVTVSEIVKRHWKSYGRNYYCRYDYDGVAVENANAVMNHLRASFTELTGKELAPGYTVAKADEFTYVDPIDHSISRNQGIRVLFTDGSRVVFRLSGTAGSGATIRVYLEKYENEADKLDLVVSDALKSLVQIALQVSRIPEITGMLSPSVIT